MRWTLALLASLSLLLLPLPAGGRTPETLRQHLIDSGVSPETVASLAWDDATRAALETMPLQGVHPIADGVTAVVYEREGQSLTVLATAPAGRGAYRLPSGPGIVFQTPGGEAIERGAVLEEPVVVSRNERAWRWVEIRLRLAPATPVEAEVTGADVDESAVRHVLRVEPAKEGALPTLAAAFDAARPLLARGEGVRISIAPGLYREGGLRLDGAGDPNATLVVEGDAPGAVVVSGADDWTGGWTPVADASGVYSRDWPHRFGLGRQTWERWNFLLTAANSRREVVAVDGALMMPVDLELYQWVDPDGAVPLSEVDSGDNAPGEWRPSGRRGPAALVPGTFGVDEQAGKLYLSPPRGVDPNAAPVEVGVRGALLTIAGRQNVVLRNLTFRHAATFVGGDEDPVNVLCRNVLVEDCAFVDNANRGLRMGESPTDVTLRRCTFSRNGWLGLAAGYKADNYLLVDSVSNSNNWRGHHAGQHSWDAGAVKFFGLNGQTGVAIRGHRSFGNLTHGLWLDQSFTPRAPIEIRDSLFAGNFFGAGLYLEKLTGPVEVAGNVVWNNGGLHGVNGTSWNVTLANNILHSASAGGPVIFLHNRGEESEYAVYSKDWTLRDNLVTVGDGAGGFYQNGVTDAQLRDYLDTYVGENNVYSAPAGARPFVGPSGPIDLAAWQSLTGQDGDAVTLPPVFGGDADVPDWGVRDPRVRERLPDLPPAMSQADRALYDAAMADTTRMLEVVASSRQAGGPPFEAASRVVDNNWVRVDLDNQANRPLVGENAWIGAGNQLVQLPGGNARFAGVPFEIRDPSGGQAAGVALASAKLETDDGGDLPATVEVPIDTKVQAIYILHGGGWFDGEADPVARYELVYDDGTTDPQAGVDIAIDGSDAERPRLGEWFHTFTPFDGDDVRHVGLTGDLGTPGAWLYVVELTNPHPDRPVRALRLSSDPARDASVIVLGVTLARP